MADTARGVCLAGSGSTELEEIGLVYSSLSSGSAGVCDSVLPAKVGEHTEVALVLLDYLVGW